MSDPLVSIGGTPSGSATPNPSESPAQAFDGNPATKYLTGCPNNTTPSSGSNPGGAWLAYQFGGSDAWRVTSYELTSGNDADMRDPKDWRLQGSDDGSTWTTVHTVVNDSGWASRGQTRSFTPGSTTTAYRRYRLLVDQNRGSTETGVGGFGIFQIADMALYGLAAAATNLDTYMATATQAWMADLYTIRLLNGTLLRWTNGDMPVTIGPDTWVLGPGIERGRIRWAKGLAVDDLDLTLATRGVQVQAGLTLGLALARGDFDGAAFELRKAYAAAPGAAVLGTRVRFEGRIAEISGGGSAWSLRVRSPLEVFDQMFPRNAVQAQCLNTLFDQACGLNSATWRVTGTVGATINAARTDFTTNLGQGSDYFRLGRMRFTSGLNAGLSRVVKAHSNASGRLFFSQPWPAVIATGDAFEIWPGCDKQQGTCSGKFSNLIRFRGMPNVPAAETTL